MRASAGRSASVTRRNVRPIPAARIQPNDTGATRTPAGSPKKSLSRAGRLPRARGKGALKIGKGEVLFSSAAVKRSEQREQRRVLGDRQQLAVAQSPASGREVAGENPDLGDERARHGWPLGLRRKYAEQRDDETDALEGHEVYMRLAAASTHHGSGRQLRTRDIDHVGGDRRRCRENVAARTCA